MKTTNRGRKRPGYRYDPAEWDQSKSVTVEPEPRMSAGISTSIRLPKQMVAQLRRIARKKGGIGYQTLLKIWIAERLEKETACSKSIPTETSPESNVVRFLFLFTSVDCLMWALHWLPAWRLRSP